MDHIIFTQQVWLALIAGGLTIAGGLVTGIITSLTAIRLREVAKLKRDLVRSYRDVAAFHRLEERYAEELAQISTSRTAEGWKRELRRRLREHGYPSPTNKATAHYAETRIEELC